MKIGRVPKGNDRILIIHAVSFREGRIYELPDCFLAHPPSITTFSFPKGSFKNKFSASPLQHQTANKNDRIRKLRILEKITG